MKMGTNKEDGTIFDSIANLASGGGKPKIDQTLWETPPEIFDVLNKRFNFTLDAACSKANCLCPNGIYVEHYDSLQEDWYGFTGGPIWLNPPYARGVTGLWVKKAYDEWKKGATIVCLLPARTDTKYHHDYIEGSAEIHLLKGRVQFLYEKEWYDVGKFPSMVVVYDHLWEKVNRKAGQNGRKQG